MPTDNNGMFHPRPWTPFQGDDRLFGVVPADDRDDHELNLAIDQQWDTMLRHTTALAVVHIVQGVHHNHTHFEGVAFRGRVLGKQQAYCQVIADVFLDSELRPGQVGDQLNRLVKTFGLVTYDPTPGRRLNWPMAPRVIDLDEAVEVVDDAFHARWPDPPAPVAVHDPMAALVAGTA